MSNIIEQSIKTNLRVMTFIGILPSKNNNTFIKIRGVVMYLTALVLPVSLAIIKLLSMETKSGNLEASFAVIYVSEALGGAFKIPPLMKDDHRLNKCVHYFAHPRFNPKNDEEQKITNECIRVCQRIENLYLCGLATMIFFWNLKSIITEDRRLPLNLWTPFNATSNSAVYYTMIILLVAVVVYGAFAVTFLDVLVGSLSYHATCQVKILKYKLQNLNQDVDVKLENNHMISFEKMDNNLKQCLNLYNDICNFVAEFEDCVSWPVFCQTAASIFTMCFGCIGLIVARGNVGLLVSLLCTFTSLFQTFCYCYFGALLYEESRDVADAIYMGSWYQYDVKIRKILIVIMERSKRPLIITSGKLVQLTLTTFTSILKTSYSLIAVFNNYD